jgi:hypothetical protein
MRFSWAGLILAPLPLPLIFSILFWSASAPILSFLFPMILGCVISYGTTMCLFRPALFLLSVWRPATALTRLFAGAGARCGDLRTGDIDVLDGQRPGFGISDGKLPGVFRALGRRSVGGRTSFCWANDGRTLLVAGDVASRPRRALVPFVTMNDPSG